MGVGGRKTWVDATTALAVPLGRSGGGGCGFPPSRLCESRKYSRRAAATQSEASFARMPRREGSKVQIAGCRAITTNIRVPAGRFFLGDWGMLVQDEKTGLGFSFIDLKRSAGTSRLEENDSFTSLVERDGARRIPSRSGPGGLISLIKWDYRGRTFQRG